MIEIPRHVNADVADPAEQSQQEYPFAGPVAGLVRTAPWPAINKTGRRRQAGRPRKNMNYSREIGHQKSPRRPEIFRLRLGLLLESSTNLLSFN
jgi:hypothetical protein